MSTDISTVVEETQAYYDGPAHEIYSRLWGDNIHMGYWREGDNLQDAMAHLNEVMAERGAIRNQQRVLDVGSGNGAAAVYLAVERGAHVVGLNLSERENDFARERVAEAGVDDQVEIRYGDFHTLPFDEGEFDVVWSQESLLHAVDKPRVLRECLRVLAPGGRLVLSDLLMRADVPDDERQTLYARVGTPEMWDRDGYQRALRDAGFTVRESDDWGQNVAPTYGAVRAALQERRDELEGPVPSDQIDRTLTALGQWVEAGRSGKISHGFFVAERPA
ncbi:methyltransferase domain-containing protein [Egibacter rhizosphaerae]|uniref:Methyltransferase domain-containing protein n=1 Tax=Egibacter rhizosphaerae TaxID=1670831 RepID=A0A411YJ82_9ACTN|nr:methyltransferase domain-containing protein [Egibacter rhizosphaerae]QBI21365.1 methyltransferase domain-containing protein [Egibacter rhizosphaerae]